MSAIDLVATLQQGLWQRWSDPLQTISFTKKQSDYIQAAATHTESAMRAANKNGKSVVGGALAVAFARGDRQLKGVDLPLFRRPTIGWAMTRTYKQQTEGTQAALQLALGTWPHVISWENRAEGIWSAVWVRPRGHSDNDPQTWSKIALVSQHASKNDADNAKGARLDWVWFDEPGYPAVMRELRKAGRPGWPFRIMHTFTPIKKNEWIDIRDDIERRGSHIVEVVASLDDATFLSEADKREQLQLYAGDPHLLARTTGAYCDVAGGSLFEHSMTEIMAMLAACELGNKYAVSLSHHRNGHTAGLQIHWPVQHQDGGIEVWGWPEDDDIGIVVVDPSSGVRDPDVSDARQPRNPAGLFLGSVKTRSILARYVGYSSSHEVGLMARALCNRCRRWLCVIETNGGWGETCLRSFKDSPAVTDGSLYYERDPVTGKLAKDPGWNQTSTRRGELIAALQRAVAEGGITIRSRAMIENLLQVRLNQNERWDQGDGKGPHGEDMIGAGIYCAVLEAGDYFRAGEPVKLASAATRAAPPTMSRQRW